MSLRPMLLATLVGVAALGTFHAPTAKAEGYFSISVGAPGPYYGGGYGYGYGYGAGDVWVSANWVSGHRGYGYGYNRGYHGYGYNRGYNRGYRGYGYNRGYNRGYRGYGHGYPGRVIYRAAPIQPLPGAYYYQRGGRAYDAYYGRGGYRGW